ncbi:MAG TPA: FISUMP domain-containing protein [Bacteroidales bacterium]|jgi:uncharacterized protein (TIGR02145 family)|nr:FISUMP domain-containing protein [Bacteroidales bacterium]
MKKVLNLLILVSFLSGIAALNGCKKDKDMPTLTTTAVTGITTTAASSGGNITDDGGAEVTARGVCWGTATGPTTAGSKTSDGTGIGSFTSSITGLTPNTKYYVRAYATNSEGTAYGNEIEFTTNPIIGATVTTTAPTTLTSTTANPGGNITADGGAPVTERGIVWALAANPTTSDNKVAASAAGTGAFTVSLTSLQPGTLYHIRAYAINTSGTAYGNDLTFTTPATKPSVTTAAVTVFTQTTATAGGNVTATGGADVTERGVYYSTQANPATTGTKVAASSAGTGTFTVNLTGLTPGTLYHVVAFATNSAGTEFGTEQTFTTSPIVYATVTSTAPTLILTSTTSVTAGGNVTATGGGTVSERGVCWGTSANPVATGSHIASGTGTGSFSVTLTPLQEGTLYYVRAYAINEAGTSYGTEYQIVTLLSDVDNNIYRTVRIGNQIWMAQNLATTHFNNGNAITEVTLDANWVGNTDPAYCWYNNDEDTYRPLYGALYNFHAANTGNLCPAGWRVPSDADFKALEMTLGLTQAEADALGWRGTTQGTQLKSASGWTTGNGTNTSGFSAVPAGYRYYVDGTFNLAGTITYFWTTTEDSPNRAFMRQLDSTHENVYRQNADESAGKSVRCVKVQP